MAQRKRRLLQQFFDRAAVVRLSPRTTDAYKRWIVRYIDFHGRRHPALLGPEYVRAFVTYLARERRVAIATQNQALAALTFLYAEVLELSPPSAAGIVMARRPHRLPNVVAREDVPRIFAQLSGAAQLMAMLMYGSGLRVSECCALRVKDIRLSRGEIVVRAGKGDRDRVTMLPASLRERLASQIEAVRRLVLRRILGGGGYVTLPDAMAVKAPHAVRYWQWYWLFPSRSEYVDAATGLRYGHHVHRSVVQKLIPAAARQAGLVQRVTCHTLRHSFATHVLESGYDIRTVQELMGHRDVSTTMLYTHVLNRGGLGVRSPLDLGPGGRGPA